jgi:hypothetical protein
MNVMRDYVAGDNNMSAAVGKSLRRSHAVSNSARLSNTITRRETL